MPILTPEHLFIHMPKTGGTWVTYVLRVFYEAENKGRQHDPLNSLDPSLGKGRVIFGTIRDPWSWYTSWYQHAMAAKWLRKRLEHYGNGSLAFRDVLYGATHPSEVQNLPVNVGVVWGVEPGKDYQHMFLESNVGLFSWAAQYIYGWPFDVHTLVDTPQLYEGLGSLLGRAIDTSLFPPRGTRNDRVGSRMEDPLGAYDDGMIQWVADAEKEIISLVGWTGPFKDAPQALMSF